MTCSPDSDPDEMKIRLESSMSKGKRYTEDLILGILREMDAGASMAAVAKADGVSGPMPLVNEIRRP